MELRQFRYFIAVAEELSFTRAAARLHISQPPLSRQIALLEKGIGVRLLERNKHTVALTQAGQVFLEEARKTLDCAQSAAAMAVRAAKGEYGRLSIGFGGSAAYTFLPSVLRTFRAQFPGVHLSLVNLPMTEQLDAILDKIIDIGTLMMPVREPALTSEFLMKEPLMVALPTGHPLARRVSLRLSMLAPYGHILFNRTGGLGFYSHIVAMCRRAGYVPKVVEEASPTESVIGLVAAGIGIAIVPAMAQKLRIAEVVYRPLEEAYATMTFALAWRKDNKTAALRSLVEIARATIPKLKT